MKRSVGKLFTSTLIAACIIALIALPVLGATEMLSSDDWSKAVYELGTGNTGKVVIEFDATALVENQDIVIGYVDSSTSPTGWAELNILVRFGDGFKNTIDARDGAAYSVVNEITVEKDKTYKVKIITNPSEGTYSTWVDGVLIAENYAYRLLSAPIDDIGKLVLITGNTEQSGKFKVTNHTVKPYQAPVSPATFDGGILGYVLAGLGSAGALMMLRKKRNR